MPKNEKNKYIIPGLAAAVGAATYAVARKAWNPTALQRASKGKLTWVSDAGTRKIMSGKNPLSRTLKNIFYGDIDVTSVDKLKNVKKVEGALYADIDVLGKTPNLPKADIGLNTASHIIREKLQNKIEFSRLKDPTHSIVPGRAFSEAVGSPKSKAKFLEAFSKIRNKHYIKPTVDYASRQEGHFPSSVISEIQEHYKLTGEVPKQYRKAVGHLFKNQSKYVIQPEVDYERISSGMDKGKPRHEFRVEFSVHKNKVSPVNITGRNADWAGGVIPINKSHADKKFISSTMGSLQRIVKANPKVFKERSFLLGADVIKDVKGKTRIVEINDQSGNLDPAILTVNYRPNTAHNLYKKVTGRDTKVTAGIKAIATSTVVGSTALIERKEKA
jgi:hypothetical protein